MKMNSKKAKGLRKLARESVLNLKNSPYTIDTMYKKMKKQYKTFKGQK